MPCRRFVQNKLFKLTPMQSSFGVIYLAIVNGQPRVLKLKEILEHFVDFRRESCPSPHRIRTAKARARAHVFGRFDPKKEFLSPPHQTKKTNGRGKRRGKKKKEKKEKKKEIFGQTFQHVGGGSAFRSSVNRCGADNFATKVDEVFQYLSASGRAAWPLTMPE